MKYQQSVRPENKRRDCEVERVTDLCNKFRKIVCLFTNTESENQATTTLNDFDVQLKCRKALVHLAQKIWKHYL